MAWSNCSWILVSHIIREYDINYLQDLVLRCIAQLVNSNQANIRSGWKNVFGVLGIAASSDREPIVEVIFRFIKFISKFYSSFSWRLLRLRPLHLTQSSQIGLFCHHTCKTVSSVFPNLDVILSSRTPVWKRSDLFVLLPIILRLIKTLSKHSGTVYGPKIDINQCFSGDDVALIPIEDRVWLRGWFPLMFELSAVIR